jgi:pimeloyl-ACP methyl ester carboxylesterase
MAHYKRSQFDQYYEEWGEGIPLLCLPAFPLNGGTVFQKQHPLGKQARFIVPDFRGMGQSTGTSDQVVNVEMLAEDMFNLLDRLTLERVVVWGISLGGYVALAMANQAKERLAGLILADTRARNDGPKQLLGRAEMIKELRETGIECMQRRLPGLLSDQSKTTHPHLLESLWQETKHQSTGHLAAIVRGMAQREDRTSLLKEIDCPVLLLRGEEDELVSQATMAEMVHHLPRAELVGIPNAGHLSPLENSKAVNATVSRFLKHHFADGTI